MNHFTSSKFWKLFRKMPIDIQDIANKNFELLKNNPNHPSLKYKSISNGKYRSVRIGLYYRAVGIPVDDGVIWFWIGNHADYDSLID